MTSMPSDIVLTVGGGALPDTKLQQLVAQLEWALDNPMGTQKPVADSGLLEAIGGELWARSGIPSVAWLRERLDEARDEERVVRLVVAGQEHQELPWELLHHPEPGFVTQHPWCTLVRRAKGKGTKAPLSLARPFRILLFVSSPEDLDAQRGRLDYEKEEELLYSALDRQLASREVEIDVAEDGCLSTLRQRLEETQYHAVILSMHGTKASTRDGEEEWGLLFEAEDTWRRRPVAGSELAKELDSLPGGRPGLIVLAACRSARLDEAAGALQGVALELHQVGIERVLGMRLSVLDRASSVFTASFFGALARIRSRPQGPESG